MLGARHAPVCHPLLQGIVQHATINNLAFGRNVDETLRVLQVRLRCACACLRHCGWGALCSGAMTGRLVRVCCLHLNLSRAVHPV